MSKKNRNASSPSGNTEENGASQVDGSEEPRRTFLKTTVAVGVAVCAVGTPICAGTRAILAPLSQEGQAGKFYPLATVDSLTATPQKFSIVDDKRDAWTTLPNQKIGSVFLRKTADDKIEAFHTLCPHAGCMIQIGVKKNPKSGVDEEMFYCPCHAAHFSLDGKRLDDVSPRDLDSLEIQVENGNVAVKFQNFIFGIAEKR